MVDDAFVGARNVVERLKSGLDRFDWCFGERHLRSGLFGNRVVVDRVRAACCRFGAQTRYLEDAVGRERDGFVPVRIERSAWLRIQIRSGRIEIVVRL